MGRRAGGERWRRLTSASDPGDPRLPDIATAFRQARRPPGRDRRRHPPLARGAVGPPGFHDPRRLRHPHRPAHPVAPGSGGVAGGYGSRSGPGSRRARRRLPAPDPAGAGCRFRLLLVARVCAPVRPRRPSLLSPQTGGSGDAPWTHEPGRRDRHPRRGQPPHPDPGSGSQRSRRSHGGPVPAPGRHRSGGMILIKGGTVLTPSGPVIADVGIEAGHIVAIGEVDADAEQVIDATDCWVGPGLVDLHVHLREPGQEWKEDIASGSAAAAVGGFTAVVAMPNTVPAIDVGHRARFVAERGLKVGLCDVVPAGALTLGREGEHLARFDELIEAGVRLFTDDGDTLVDAGLLRRAMEYLADRDCVIAQHAEDPGLAGGGHMHEGSVSSRLGMRGLPALAEETVVARDLALVELTGATYHVQHVSTAGTVELIRRAKAAGLPVTAEVAPHHLVFDHHEVESMDPNFKMYPPLRTPDDVAELRRALLDGTIDAVATDHAPHADHEQEVT